MQVTFRGKRPEAYNIYTFEWEPTETFSFTAGQFMKMLLPHPNADERGEMHFFTISASPTETYLANTTKFSQPSSTFKQTLRVLEPGARVEITGPYGEFVLPPDEKQPLVFVAGGIGVTPYRSILKYLVDTNQTRPIQLLYAANQPQELAFRELFDHLPRPIAITYMVSQSNESWSGAVGQLSGAKIQELAGGLDGKLVYLSGPKPMVQAFKDQLLELGINEAKIMTDYFPGYTKI